MPKNEPRTGGKRRPKADSGADPWKGGREVVRGADEYLQRETEKRRYLISQLDDRQGERPDKVISPWLLLRYDSADRGMRPIPPGVPFWISPDISVETSDVLGRPVAGQVNHIHARIHNLGAFSAAPVKVDFYWGDPSLGLGSAHMHKVKAPGDPLEGSVYLEIPSLHSADVRSAAWIPVMVNNGHECLIVNCTHYALDPIHHPFRPVLDRHVGQRNVEVVEVQAGAFFQFRLKLNNLLMSRVRAVISVRIELLRPVRPLKNRMAFREAIHEATQFRGAGGVGRGPQAGLDQARMLAQRTEGAGMHPVELRHGAPSLMMELCERRRSYWLEPSAGGGGGGVETSDGCGGCREPVGVGGSGEATLRELVLNGGEQREAMFEGGVPDQARPGDLVVYHIFQRAEAVTVGGYTVVAVVAG